MPETPDNLGAAVENLIAMINTAIEAATSPSRPCQRSLPGWTTEIKEAQTQARHLRRHYQRYHTEEAWEAYKKARNLKGRLIKKALQRSHNERVQQASTFPEGL